MYRAFIWQCSYTKRARWANYTIIFLCRGVARGGHGWMSRRHGWKKLSPWITDRWLLCNWYHTPDVTKTKGKCAISTLIFGKFSGGYAPDTHTGEGLRRPSPDATPSALRRFAPPRLARDLRSLHHRVPPYENAGYAPVLVANFLWCVSAKKCEYWLTVSVGYTKLLQ